MPSTTPKPAPATILTPTPGPRHSRQSSYRDPSWGRPKPTWPPPSWPLPKAIASLVASVALAIASWFVFKDPWRNADANGFEIGVAIVFGLIMVTFSVTLAFNAVRYLREALRPKSRDRQNPR